MSDQTNNTWFFEDDAEKSLGIETVTAQDGNKQKRCTLSTGKVAVLERLKAKELKMIRRQMGGDAEKFQQSIIAACVTIAGEKLVPEDLDEMWMDDYTKLLAMVSINFPLTQNA